MPVVTPEPTALTDAYALIKVLSTRYAEHSFAVLVNMARGELEARKTFTHLTRVAERFLHVSLRWAGYVPWDSEVPEAVRSDFERRGGTRVFRTWVFPWARMSAL